MNASSHVGVSHIRSYEGRLEPRRRLITPSLPFLQMALTLVSPDQQRQLKELVSLIARDIVQRFVAYNCDAQSMQLTIQAILGP